MAERLPDLSDVLHAAEDERTRALAGTPTHDVLARTRTALRAVRRRRTAVAVGGVAAAGALVAGVMTWQPRGEVQPAGPGPTTTAVEVPGVGPLRRASEDDVRGAPTGSALVLWQRASSRETEGERTRETPVEGDTWFLLLTPDGTVRQVGPAPLAYDVLLSWDPATATAVMAADGEGSYVVDVLTGRVVGASGESGLGAAMSPDGTREATVLRDEQGISLVVGPVGGADVRHPLPAPRCSSVVWLDDARLVLSCDGEGPQDEVARGSELVLVDAATGAVLDRAALAPDDGDLPTWPTALADGTVVLPTTVRDGGVCRTRVERLDGGLRLEPLGEVPGGLARPPAGTAEQVLTAGSPTCEESTGTAVWSLDTATGEVTEVLAPGPWPDGPLGMIDWAR